MSGRLDDAKLLELADDAFVVLNWAKRQGFDKAKQLEELKKTFEIRLGYREAVRPAEAAE